MKKLILTSILSLSFAFTYAQGVLTFEKTTHEFGDVKETGGPISVDFKFKNSGDQPIIISNVQASCGCTTPDWTKTPVGPGQTGYIKAQYNPLGRPGQFNKSMTVTSNATEGTTVVFIKGNVVPDAATVAAPTDGSSPAVTPSMPMPKVTPDPDSTTSPRSKPSAKPNNSIKKDVAPKSKSSKSSSSAKKTTTTKKTTSKTTIK